MDFKTASIQKEENGSWTLHGNPEKRKEQVIKKTMPKKLKRSLLLLLYLFHWRTLIWYVQWPYYEIRYWIKHRSRNKDEDSLQGEPKE